VTDQLAQELGAWLGKQETARGPRTGPAPGANEAARRWGKEASAGTTVALVNLGERGGDSHRDATLWSDGKELLSGVSLRAALYHFRSEARVDIGHDGVNLAKHRGDDAAEKWAAEAILKELVGKAEPPVPALAAALHHEHPNKYLQTLVRLFAAKWLAQFGTTAREAIPALVRTVRTEADFGVRLEAAFTLAAIGTDAVPALAQILVDGDVREAERSIYGKLYPAVWALCKVSPPAKAAVPALVGVLGDANAHVRERAAEALGTIGPDARDAVAALAAALDDREWTVRSNAAKALGRIGRFAEAALPALRKALADANQSVRQAAGEALANIPQAGGG
jgi:hypothetical protein